ncbi:hypothetical protein TNCV_4217651 [Trichonephila clavipes]|nr:hypothetical protein TNCV_4217651 [Trichonephila clavipes]
MDVRIGRGVSGYGVSSLVDAVEKRQNPDPKKHSRKINNSSVDLRAYCLHAEIMEVEVEVVSPSIVSSGNFAELNRTVTCMVLKANDRRTSCPCHDVSWASI